MRQFDRDPNLRARVSQITRDYFSGGGSAGLRLYEERLAEDSGPDPGGIRRERNRARGLLSVLVFE